MSLQEQLHELYLLDQQVRGLSGRLDAATRRHKAQTTKHEQLQQQHNELHEQLKHGQARAAAAEKQSAEVEEKVTRLREQMNSVRSNKEYSALLVEVNSLKLDKSKFEDQALGHMSEVEALQQRMSEIQEQQEQQVKLVELARQEVEAARAEVGDRLDQLKAQRDEAAGRVPPEPLSLFKRLANSYDGEALAEVQEQDRRRMEYTCGGCYMQLPIERVNVVMARQDEVATCSNCGRILYINKELKSAISSK